MGTIAIERLTLKKIMKRINKWFMLKKVEIELTENVKEGEYDDETHIIRINPKLPKAKFAEVYIHELLHHDWSLDHEPFTRAMGYRSYGYKKDRLSALLYQDIFRKNAGWLRRAK
jgi:hypothetical protein